MNIEQLLEDSGWLQRLAWSLVHDHHDADDLVQETWVAALAAESKGGVAVDNPRSWLKTVVRNFAYLRFRRSARQRAREELASVTEIQPEPECALERLESVRLLIEALLHLEGDDQEVIMLRYVNGLDSSAISERLGLKPGAVRMRLKRSLERMRSELDREQRGDRHGWMTILAPLAQAGASSSAALASGLAGAARAIGGSTLAKAGILLVVVSIAVVLLSPSVAPRVSELEQRVESLESELEASQERLAAQAEALDALIETLAELSSDPTGFADSV